MAKIFLISCPSCATEWPIRSELRELNIPLRCPVCQLEFKKEESPRWAKIRPGV